MAVQKRPQRKPPQKRMALTIPESMHAVLFELAELQGKPAATLVTELLVEMRPQLEGMVKIQRHLNAGRIDAAKTALRHMVGDSMAEILQEQLPLVADKDKGRK